MASRNFFLAIGRTELRTRPSYSFDLQMTLPQDLLLLYAAFVIEYRESYCVHVGQQKGGLMSASEHRAFRRALPFSGMNRHCCEYLLCVPTYHAYTQTYLDLHFPWSKLQSFKVCWLQ
jgi:hypothetical protein